MCHFSTWMDGFFFFVVRVKMAADFYEILGVPKDANDSLLKKSYHKMALQVTEECLSNLEM